MPLMIGVIADLSRNLVELMKIVKEQNEIIDRLQESQVDHFDLSDISQRLDRMIVFLESGGDE
jgi:hypothetical protein